MAATDPVSMPSPTTRKPLMTRRGRVVVLTAACFVAATLAFVPRQRQEAPQQESPASDSQLLFADVELEASTLPAARRATVTKTPESNTQPEVAATTLPVPVKTDYTTVVTAPAPREQGAAAMPSVVTISGCLERDAERFRLKDTSGEAPRSRSWRSGFLRRNSSAIDVIDEADRLHLPTYIGQRVSVTGTLVDREIQVRSVAIVAESCQEESA